MNYWTQSKNNIYVAAHRGSCDKYPENTMPAFRAAVEAGVDQIELDVRVTRDNELVIIHDSTVDRTTNGTGKVCDKLLAELCHIVNNQRNFALRAGGNASFEDDFVVFVYYAYGDVSSAEVNTEIIHCFSP